MSQIVILGINNVTKVILEIDDIAKILPKIFIITSITGILSNDMDM